MMRKVLPLHDIIEENASHRTFVFKTQVKASPGRFFMISDLAGAEKPFSVSGCAGGYLSFTVKKTGVFTERMFSMTKGDNLSLRGPYGRGFNLPHEGAALCIGGGCGAGPLRYLARELAKTGSVDYIAGARSAEEHLFVDEMLSFCRSCTFVSDDGSLGVKQTSIDALKSFDLSQYTEIFLSGPEPMLKAGLDFLADKSPNAQFLIERYMKCAIGICGSCSIDPLGVRVCVEGPVFPLVTMKKLSEFGKYKRSASGEITRFGG